jgi:hypothetical protein
VQIENVHCGLRLLSARSPAVQQAAPVMLADLIDPGMPRKAAMKAGDLVATFGIDDIELSAGRTTAGAAALGTPRDRGFLA